MVDEFLNEAKRVGKRDIASGRRLTALRIGKKDCLYILGAKAIAGMAGAGCRARTRQENNYAPSAS